MATKTKDYSIRVTDQQDIYEFSAKGKNAIYILGLGIDQGSINTGSFNIINDKLVFSASNKTFIVSNYKDIKYIKTYNAETYKTELLDIISGCYVDNTNNEINILSRPNYNSKKLTLSGTNYNDVIDASFGYEPTGRTNIKKNKGLTINGGNGNDAIIGTDYNDVIKGGNGDDTITGLEGNDTITGGAGKNTIVIKNEEFGNDIINLTKNEELIIDLTDCTDISDLSDLKYSIIGKNLIITIPEDDECNKGTLTLKNYTKNILKSLSFNLFEQDKITFNNLTDFTNNVVFNYDNENINKKGVLTGSAYNDEINVENTTKKKYTINAGNGKNDITVSSGKNVINSGKDNDTINIYLEGNYTVNAGAGTNTININNLNNFGTVTINEQKVSAANHINFSNGLANAEYQKKGNDLYIIDNDSQVIVKNYYVIVKNKASYFINGQDIESYLSEQTTDITGSGKIYGTVNNDNITISGNKAVTIYAGEGNDSIGYAKGNRTFYFYEGDGHDTIQAGGGTDILKFEKNTNVSTEFEYNKDGSKNLIFNYGNNDSVFIQNYNDTKKMYYYIGNNKYEIIIPIPEVKKEEEPIEEEPIIIDQYTILGTSRNDIIYGTTDIDNRIYAFEGDDIIYNSKGSDTINAGLGNNTIHITAFNGLTTIENGGGNDTIILGGSPNFVPNKTSLDIILSYGSHNTITRRAYIHGYFINNSHSVKTIVYNGYKDLATELNKYLIFFGTKDDDIIYGTNNSDTIYGGEGNDIIYGYEGSDTYVFNNGYGHDTLYVEDTNNILFSSDTGNKTYTWNGDDLVIGYNNNSDSITIKNYNPSNTNIIVNIETTNNTYSLSNNNYVNLATLVPEKPAPMMMSALMMNVNELSEQVASFSNTNNTNMNLNYNDLTDNNTPSTIIAEYTPTLP